ncbi:class I SAM-dependent methyltransferase [Vibrio sinaloensis]|uniref:class I SAM-dependent methyltransferase n=1 Tax=Photobacterium sp. (strain ATCC 43367) TaxID=379097 RepID=UPI0035EDE772
MDATIHSAKTELPSSSDIEYIDGETFNQLAKQLDMLFPTAKPFHLLEVGGGRGLYADKVLTKYPSADVTLIEPDKGVLELNRPNNRKHLHCSLFEEHTFDQHYDIIQFNWVLHHFVANTYYETILLQQQALRTAYDQLADNGLVVMFENFHEGILVNNLTNEWLGSDVASSNLDPSIRRLITSNARSAVCFHNRSTWHDMLLNAGFEVILHVPPHSLRSLGQFSAIPTEAKQQNSGLIIAKKAN